MKKVALTLVSLSALVLPVVALAVEIPATPPSIPTDLMGLLIPILNAVWIIFAFIAIISFVVAGVLFVTSQGSAEKVAQARQALVWGIAGVVVGILAFVIVQVVYNIF